MMPILFGGGVISTTASAQVVEEIGTQEEFARQREIQRRQERIRLLYAQGEYLDVIEEAEELLAIDERNATAILIKDRAEQRIAAGQTDPPTSTIASAAQINMDRESFNELLRSQGLQVAPERPAVEAQPAPEVVSPAAGQAGAYGSDEFKLTTFLGAMLGLLVGAGLLIMMVAWVISRRRAREARAATGQGMATSAISDMPTVRNMGGGGSVFAPSDSGRGKSSAVVHDEVTQHLAGDDKEAEEPPPPVEPPSAASEEEEGPAHSLSSVNVDLPSMDTPPPEEAEHKSSLGIDYSQTDDALYSGSQVQDVEKTDASPHAETAIEEPQDSGVDIAPPAAGEEPLPATDEGEDEGIDISAPAVDDEEEKETRRLSGEATVGIEEGTYNSLMFGASAKEEKAAQEEEAEDSIAPEELSATSFDREFSNVMFGTGAEETKIPEAGAEEAEEAESTPTGEEETVVFSAPKKDSRASVELKLGDDVETSSDADDEGSGEKTVPISTQTGGSSDRVSMFDKQRDAGRAALEAEDYVKAVQCLSVAASLKPGDKEVRALLEEARQKRRGV